MGNWPRDAHALSIWVSTELKYFRFIDRALRAGLCFAVLATLAVALA